MSTVFGKYTLALLLGVLLVRGYALFLAESVSSALRCGLFRSIEAVPIVFVLGVETKKYVWDVS
jgi:hypothetical protein